MKSLFHLKGTLRSVVRVSLRLPGVTVLRTCSQHAWMEVSCWSLCHVGNSEGNPEIWNISRYIQYKYYFRLSKENNNNTTLFGALSVLKATHIHTLLTPKKKAFFNPPRVGSLQVISTTLNQKSVFTADNSGLDGGLLATLWFKDNRQ